MKQFKTTPQIIGNFQKNEMEVQIDLLVEEVKSNHAPVNDQLILPLS